MRSQSTVSTELQKTYEDMVGAVSRRIQENLVDGWKKVETRFQARWARLTVSEEEELFRESSDVQSLLRNSPAFFSSSFTQAIEVGSSNKILSTGAKKTKRPLKVSSSKGAKYVLKVCRVVKVISMLALV